MTNHRDLFATLAAPFEADEIKLRTQGGKQLHYITSRTAMNRLDEVIGPENWWDDYVPSEHSVFCRLTIRLPDGQILTKCDAGGMAGMADPGDDDKSGYADAFKRAAVKFGVGRYLYRDGIPRFSGEALQGRAEATEAPQPTNGRSRSPAPEQQPSRPEGRDAPRTGRALFAWAKDHDTEHEYGLIKHLIAWAKRQEIEGRMVDWAGESVSRGYSEACRVIRAKQQIERCGEPMDEDEWERTGRREA